MVKWAAMGAAFLLLLSGPGFGAGLHVKAPSQFGSSQKSGKQTHIFGNWGGLRPWLKKRGVDLGFSYLSETAGNPTGGRSQGVTYAEQWEMKLTLNWEKIANLQGFSTHFDMVNRGGRNLSGDYIGDDLFHAQEIYGGTDDVLLHMVYLYGQEKLLNGKLVLKGGRMPVLSDFGSLPTGCDFMALAVCATRGLITNLGWTVFPRATWGGMAKIKLAKNWAFKAGGYEVNPNTGGPAGFNWSTDDAKGVNIPLELDWTPKLGPDNLPGIYKIGGFYDTANFSDWYTATNGQPVPLTTASARQSNRTGFYVLAQQKLWQPSNNANGGLTVLGGYVYNTPENSVFEHFAFVGMLDKGLIPGRPNDRAGLSFTYGRVGTSLTDVQQLQSSMGFALSNGAPGVQTDEMVLEANYNIAAYPGLHVMPDLQYVIRPDGTNTYPDALVLGLQVNAKF